ncbi:uncharacterized protein LOC120009202 [Tripterygium wilfordii]|nr:uncharacterized protein LOC120009202 [Tripterygium wilfordii]
MVQPPSSSLLQGQNLNLVNDRHQSATNGFHENNNNNNIIRRPDQFEQCADHVNMPSWAEFYPTGDGTVDEAAQSRERALLELYLSQFTPQILTPPTHHPP